MISGLDPTTPWLAIIRPASLSASLCAGILPESYVPAYVPVTYSFPFPFTSFVFTSFVKEVCLAASDRMHTMRAKTCNTTSGFN